MHNIRGTNLFLLEDRDGLTLIDSGLPGSAGAVLRYVQGLGRQAVDLLRILLTHGHSGHSGSAWSIRQVGILRLFHLPPWRGAIDEHMAGRDTLPVLGGLHVITAPSHTPGSVCLLAEREGILCIGDLLSRRCAYVSRSVPFPETDLRRYHESLERVAELDFETVCCGHGSVLLGGAGRSKPLPVPSASVSRSATGMGKGPGSRLEGRDRTPRPPPIDPLPLFTAPLKCRHRY